MAKELLLNDDYSCCNALTRDSDKNTRPAEPDFLNEHSTECQGKQAAQDVVSAVKTADPNTAAM